MEPLPIVMSAPGFHLLLGVLQGQEPVLFQALLTEASVERCLFLVAVEDPARSSNCGRQNGVISSFFSLARIHRSDDVTAAEWAMRGKGDGPGTISGKMGPVSVFSRRRETS